MQFDRSVGRRAMLVLAVTSIGFCTVSHAENAPESKPATTQATPTQPPAGSKTVCRSEKVIGSNIPRRVCHTQAELEAEREASQHDLNTMNQPRGGMGAGTTGG